MWLQGLENQSLGLELVLGGSGGLGKWVKIGGHYL